VRKQYHFRPGSRGLDAWDVDRLVAAVDEVPVEDVPLTEIGELDSTYWFDHGYSPTVHNVVGTARASRQSIFAIPTSRRNGYDGCPSRISRTARRTICLTRHSDFRYGRAVPSEASWYSYPADVPAAERIGCSFPGCGAPGEVVHVQTGSILLPFGNRSTRTTVWCSEHARANGYAPPAREAAEPSRAHLNAFQRWVVRELGGSAPTRDQP
jgi:hypothetical protein